MFTKIHRSSTLALGAISLSVLLPSWSSEWLAAGQVVFDMCRLDGTPGKSVDVNKVIALGWKTGISLDQGIRDAIRDTYEWNVSRRSNVAHRN
jgi:nucleoside-diphosphate-sugar epimerase